METKQKLQCVVFLFYFFYTILKAILYISKLSDFNIPFLLKFRSGIEVGLP